MRVHLFVFLFAIVALAIGCIALTILTRPSAFFRYLDNPLQPDSPENRVKFRGVGLIFCLFSIVLLSLVLPVSERFHSNILVALWLSPVGVPILLWILWLIAKAYVRRALIEGPDYDPSWERRMTFIFCSVLAVVIALAFYL